jgi:histidyl-tRNA synthetase
LRWYSIPNLWRYERPQRGRLREHWQLNVDIFGVKDTTAELEMIGLIDAIFKSFGARDNTYEIRLNNRGLTDYLLKDYLGLAEKARRDVSRLIDKLPKMERGKFIAAVDEMLTAKQREAGTTEKLLALLDAKKLADLPAEAQKQPAAKDLKALMEQLKTAGIKNAVFDGTLMRGFDYYTGIVFEVFDTDPENNRSMLGGGRYDGLVGLFGVDPVPTVGFGWGDVTLANFLAGHRLMPALKPETDVYVARIGEVDASKVVAELRKQGLNVAVDLSGKKIGDQLKTADKKGIEQVAIIGEEELKAGKINLKNLKTGKESKLSLPAAAKAIKGAR